MMRQIVEYWQITSSKTETAKQFEEFTFIGARTRLPINHAVETFGTSAHFFLCCLYECYSRDNKKIHSSFFPGTATAVFITKPGNGSGVLWIPNRINLTHNKIKADYYFYLCTMRRCGSECAKCNFAFVVRWYGQKFAHFCKDPKHVNVNIVM